ncbi:TPA: hypothetical protein ACH3X2_013312 [Trebouxia sp. C0005]
MICCRRRRCVEACSGAKLSSQLGTKTAEISQKSGCFVARLTSKCRCWFQVYGFQLQSVSAGMWRDVGVVKVQQYGCFVALNPQVQALFHVSELDVERVNDPASLFQAGDRIDVKARKVMRMSFRGTPTGPPSLWFKRLPHKQSVVWLLQGNTTMPTADKALEVVKIHYGRPWDSTIVNFDDFQELEILKRTSIYVIQRTDVMDDAAVGVFIHAKVIILRPVLRSNTVSTVVGPSQSRGNSSLRKGKGHPTAMQGDQHAGRGSSRGGGSTGKHAGKGYGNNGRGSGKASRGAIGEEANTAISDMLSA